MAVAPPQLPMLTGTPHTAAHFTAQRGEWRRRRSCRLGSPASSRPSAKPRRGVDLVSNNRAALPPAPPGHWWGDDPTLERRIPDLLRDGRASEARELLRTHADPRHGVSQFYQGICIGMLEGEASAVDTYEAAVAAMPGTTYVYVNLIRALLARAHPGDLDRALALGSANAAAQPGAAEPQYSVGVILMQMGRTRDAAKAFEKALHIDPAHHGALVNGAHTLTALFADEPRTTVNVLRRRIMSVGRLGVAAGLWEDPQQRPPCLVRNLRPSQPWHDPSSFEMVAILEAAFPAICAELLAAQTTGKKAGNGGGAFTGAFTPVGGRAVHDHTIVAKGEWRELPLFGNGSRHETNCAMCPHTAAAVARCPPATDLAFAGGGETLFSVVRGGTHLRPHCGSTNARLTCHLGIVIPEGCRVRVGDEIKMWTEGKCIVFDDSYEHEVWNDSDQDRVVLLINFWHPALPPEQRRIEVNSHGYDVK